MNESPRQTFGTEGIPPMERPGFLTRYFVRIVEWAERLNLRCAIHGNPPIYDNAVFPWAAEIEKAYPAIRAELERLLPRKREFPDLQDILSDVRTISRDTSWKTFVLAGFGVRADANIALCPETWRAVKRIPGLKTALFSIFDSGKHLPAHRGAYNGVLRLHLGLIVPEPRNRVGIRVDRKICHWEEGKVLIFDDAYEHEAWNYTDGTRVVLFVDFVKPLKFPANLVNWLILNLAVFTPFLQEGKQAFAAWERKFHRKGRASAWFTCSDWDRFTGPSTRFLPQSTKAWISGLHSLNQGIDGSSKAQVPLDGFAYETRRVLPEALPLDAMADESG